MRLAGIHPNHITFVCILSGCAAFPERSELLGALIHGYVCKLGLDRNNVMVGTALVYMYAKYGLLYLARLVFDCMGVKNLISWNTMIDGYVKNGEIEYALELFDKMPERDAISWTALINGFVKSGHYEEALNHFREMQISCVMPDYVTIVAILAACANLGTLGLGLWIHRLVLKNDLKYNVKINNSLIDMYSRCGCMEYACQVFDKMQKRTLVSWNSIIVGFAVNGFAKKALEHFHMMQKEGFIPDGVSFTGALTACSYSGLVEEGLQYFDTMKRVYNVSPRIEHYGCIVDLYSRAGRLEEALEVIESMPMKPNEVVLGSLLAACRTHGNISLAERVVKHLVELNFENDSSYVLLANMYASVGRWDGASEVRRRMKSRAILKRPGFSSIEINCEVYEFVAGDKSHVDTEIIYGMLDLLSFELKLFDYAPKNVDVGLYENS